MRLVLDTSIVVAAVRSDLGASRVLLDFALRGSFQLLLSVPLILEYEAVLKRPKQLSASGATCQEIEKLLDALVATAVPVRRSFLWRPMLRDPDDDMVIQAALNGRADLLVTFNLKDFEPEASRMAVSVVTPQVALREIRRRDEEE